MASEPSFYDRCAELFKTISEILTPERLLEEGIREYNRRIDEFNRHVQAAPGYHGRGHRD